MSLTREAVAWMDGAACAAPDVDPETFHDRKQEHVAKAICETCPVVDRCLDALEDVARDLGGPSWVTGVWAGTTPAERRAARLGAAHARPQHGGRPRAEIDVDRLRQLAEAGATNSAIAEALNIGKTTARGALERAGLTATRDAAKRARRANRDPATVSECIDPDRLREMAEAGENISEIADIFDVSRHAIRTALNAAGLSDVRREAAERRKVAFALGDAEALARAGGTMRSISVALGVPVSTVSRVFAREERLQAAYVAGDAFRNSRSGRPPWAA